MSIVVQGAQLKALGPKVLVFPQQGLPIQVDALIEAPQVQKVVEHVVAGEHRAARRHLALPLPLAEVHKILEKRRPVIDTPPLQPQGVPHQVEQGGFPRPVAAIEDGDGFHLQTGFLPRPKDAKRVNILVTSPAVDRFSQRKLLVGLGRQSKTG